MLQIKMFFPKVENSVKQRQTSEDISFSLKSFFSWEKDNSNAAIDALMTLVSHNKSGKSCSQADIFDFICEREGVRKLLSLYQQRRFAKPDKAAASIVQSYPVLNTFF